LTGTGSLISRDSILLLRLEILASTVIDDSIEWRPLFEEIEFVFLEFLGVDSYWKVFSARSLDKSHP